MTVGIGIRAVVVAAGMTLASSAGIVRGEATGDLYVASPSGILEIVSATASVAHTMSVTALLGPIAIRSDGRELFAISDGRSIVRLDLESMTVTSRVALPAPAGALAYPRGEQLVAALPSLRQIAILDGATGGLSRSDLLPGPVDLLAADRGDGRVVAAAHGGRWVAVFDPATGSVRSTTIDGSVTAVAFDSAASAAIVATSAPDRLVGLDARDFSTAWSAPLPAAPSAVAVTSDRIIVAAGRTLWSLDRIASPRPPIVSASLVQLGARRWASLVGSATGLTVSDDGTVLYAMEDDRIEEFAVPRPAVDQTAAAGANGTIRLAGSRTPLAIVAVPGARPFLGGAGTAPPRSGKPIKMPSTNTVPGAVPWTDAGQIPLAALLVGLLILVLGVSVIRWYERHGEA
jgi:hypothetical protein